MARLFDCGFELNTLTTGVEVSTVAGGPAVAAGSARSGAYGLRCNAVGGAAMSVYRYCYAANQSTQAYARVYVRASSTPSGTASSVLAIENVANARMGAIDVNALGKPILKTQTGTSLGVSAVNICDGAWHLLELLVDATTSPGSLQARLDGVSFATGTNDVQGLWGRCRIGVGAITWDASFDDWSCNDSTGTSQTSWPQPEKLILLSPNGDGDNHAMTDQAAGAGTANNYTLVDELPPNDATDYVQSPTNGVTDMYQVTNGGLATTDVVNVVSVSARVANITAADATTAAKLQIEKTTGGTKTQSAAIIPNGTTWRTNTSTTLINPVLVTYADPDGAVWTSTTVDSMQIGQTITATGTRTIAFTAVWVYVAYTPQAGPNLPLLGCS